MQAKRIFKPIFRSLAITVRDATDGSNETSKGENKVTRYWTIDRDSNDNGREENGLRVVEVQYHVKGAYFAYGIEFDSEGHYLIYALDKWYGEGFSEVDEFLPIRKDFRFPRHIEKEIKALAKSLEWEKRNALTN